MTKHNLTHFAAGLLLTLATACPVFSASTSAPATTQSISNTRWAYRDVRFPTGDFAPSPNDISAAIDRNAKDLAPKLLGASADKIVAAPSPFPAANWLSVNYVVLLGQTDFQFTLSIPKGAAPPIAKEFLDAVIAKSQEQVKQLYAQTRAKPIEDATRAVAQSQQRYHDAADELNHIRQALRQGAGRVDVSPQGIAEAVAKLEEEKQKTELDMMGKQARRDAIEKRLSEQSEKIQGQVKDDAIAAQLQKVVDARQEKVKQLKSLHEHGSATATEISDAIAAAADSEAKLLQRRHDAAVEAGGDALASLNREALNLSIDLSEAKAQLKFIDDRLSHLASVTDDMDRLERARTREQSAGKELDQRTRALHDLQEKIASLPPGELTIVSSDNRATPPDNGAPE